MSKDQEDLFDGPGDQTDDGRPSGMRQQQPKKQKGPDSLALLVMRATDTWRTGVCEGAAMFRKRLLERIQERGTPGTPEACAEDLHWTMIVLADIGEVDETFRKQFPDEYQRQLDMRTND